MNRSDTIPMKSARDLRNDWLDYAKTGTIEQRFGRLSPAEQSAALKLWDTTARDDQWPPGGDWLIWLLMGGRGSGKTRTGAEWVRGMALGLDGFADAPVGRIALVGETIADVREVMIEGESGILRVHPFGRGPTWYPSRRTIVWDNGARAQAFSSEDPEALRGPQFGASWSDEVAKWRNADATWDMLQFGLRLGARPRQVVTTTPRPVPLMRRLLAMPGTIVTRSRTADNARHLATGFLARMADQYGGTRLGRQELDGEMIEDRADALFTRDAIEAGRVATAPEMARIVVAVDPPASRRSGTCGIVAAGIGRDGIGYVLADVSVGAARPDQWAARAVALYRRLHADALVAEVNQGGDMVAAVIREVDAGVPVKDVRATRGKYLRAEPVAALYAQGRVRHVGAFAELEDEMADFGLDGLSSGRSPDRLDAMVWAVTALMLEEGGAPRVRRM
jgi:phage terminase large subunit-like protein